jgi:signal transduction histidine kinase
VPLDAGAEDRLLRAQQAEFAALDVATAQRLFDELLSAQGPQGVAALPVIASAAWQAQRAGMKERVEELMQRLDTAFASSSPASLASPELAAACASAALLHAESGTALPAWSRALLPALPVDLAQPTLARLRERGVDTAGLRETAVFIVSHRAHLNLAAKRLPLLGDAVLVAPQGQSLLLWFPAGGGDGRGAMTSVDVLDLVHVAPVTHRRGWLRFSPPPPGAAVVLPELVWVEPLALPEPGWLARPGSVLAAVIALAVVAGVSMLLSLRALRRETDAVRAQAEFLTVVTHELKTPVAAIRLIAEVLHGDEVSADKQRDYFALLAGESARLTMLIENVLDLGQQQRGERAFDPRPGDLPAVVREAVALFAPLAERAGMQVELREGVGAATAELDGNALLQALLNVFDNARKYAAAGGRIAVTTAATASQFEVRVRDFGPGVPADEREAVFERFRHGSIPGIGLGLHLAQTIARRHGGELRCISVDGPGAEFVFTLPLATAAGEEVA